MVEARQPSETQLPPLRMSQIFRNGRISQLQGCKWAIQQEAEDTMTNAAPQREQMKRHRAERYCQRCDCARFKRRACQQSLPAKRWPKHAWVAILHPCRRCTQLGAVWGKRRHTCVDFSAWLKGRRCTIPYSILLRSFAWLPLQHVAPWPLVGLLGLLLKHGKPWVWGTVCKLKRTIVGAAIHKCFAHLALSQVLAPGGMQAGSKVKPAAADLSGALQSVAVFRLARWGVLTRSFSDRASRTILSIVYTHCLPCLLQGSISPVSLLVEPFADC